MLNNKLYEGVPRFITVAHLIRFQFIFRIMPGYIQKRNVTTKVDSSNTAWPPSPSGEGTRVRSYSLFLYHAN